MYGLREAILYFHEYEFQKDPSKLIDNAIEVYEEISDSYIANVKKLENSDDPVIRQFMDFAED